MCIAHRPNENDRQRPGRRGCFNRVESNTSPGIMSPSSTSAGASRSCQLPPRKQLNPRLAPTRVSASPSATIRFSIAMAADRHLSRSIKYGPAPGENPNQQVHLNEGRTVWALFLVSCYESTLRNEATKLLKEVWFRVCKLMIRHHVSSTAWFDNNTSKPLTVEGILGEVFGQDKKTELLRLMKEARLQ
ncbi:Putative protein of unknown function [Podospora comata]|uniref:Uncharacterized protein n=1 Tax=Podospora comata TaxID=48703 RepID=A0ABY6SHJ8_PODCO|nr:Putative protein of unknown function [Podospora comata]